MQIGELLNGFSEDQKRLSEKKNQQKLSYTSTEKHFFYENFT